MPCAKNQTLTMRTTAKMEDLLRMAAEPGHPSVASMMEILALAYARPAKHSSPAQQKPVS